MVGFLGAGVLALTSLAPASVQAAGPKVEKVEGYAEWRSGDVILVDGQRVRLAKGGRFKGSKEAKSFAVIPLGYEVKARGTRDADGVLIATELEAKQNGSAMFEGEVRSATDEAEATYRKAGRFLESADNGKMTSIGRLYEDGPEVERVRWIMDALVPPYLDPDSIRVYVIDNDEWNAFAMGNYSIYVFTGLLDDMDDDEVAIVLGHELAHATHEHTRRQFKKTMWIQLAALGVTAAAEEIDDKKARAVVQLAATFGALAWTNGYGRDLEDQADRVGLRYAYEAGFDITKGPRLWNRFAKKYGEQGKVANFFFSDHSLSRVRATHLERELAFNYPDGPKSDGRTRTVAAKQRRSSPASPTAVAVAAAPAATARPAGTQALAATSTTPSAGATSAEIKVGMTPEQVRAVLGSPKEEIKFASRVRWTYPDVTVVFENGKVQDVKF
jgi:hypothetical protein